MIAIKNAIFPLFLEWFGKNFHNSWEGCCFPALSWFWHFQAQNAFFSICFPKSSHPFWGTLFALRTSVTVSELAGTTLNSSAGTSASHSHLCPGPPYPPLAVNLSLSFLSLFSLTTCTTNTHKHGHVQYTDTTHAMESLIIALDLWQQLKSFTFVKMMALGMEFKL